MTKKTTVADVVRKMKPGDEVVIKAEVPGSDVSIVANKALAADGKRGTVRVWEVGKDTYKLELKEHR
jgi:hypothetical protein